MQVYEHGLPFSETLHKNIVSQNKRVFEEKKASLIIIDGGVGEGKTTLAVEVADAFNKLHGHDEILLNRTQHPQLSMGGKEFMQNLRVCYTLKLVVLIYDEAGDFNRKGAITRFNQMLMRTFETYRGFKIVVILSLPNFAVLENDLFDAKIPRMLIHCHDRGKGHGNFSGYSLAGMGWLRYWYDKLPKGSKYKCYRKVTPNFRGHFLDISPARSKKLDMISTKGKLEILKKAEVRAEGLLTYKDLSAKVGRSLSWVKQMVSKHKIKYKKSIGLVRYFDEDTLNRLTDLKSS